MNLGRIFYISLVVLSLSACATQSPQYYTLVPASAATDRDPTVANKTTKYAISVQPVVLPEQVDRPQIVISETDSAMVAPLNSALWASPLSDEIRSALSNALTRELGVLDIASGGAPESLPIWKVFLHVQRFDSVYNQRAIVDATWRLAPVHQSGKKTLICRAEVQVDVESGMSALVAGHQEALKRLASVIAAQISGSRSILPVVGMENKGCTS